MKFSRFAIFAGACALMASCSSDEPSVNPTPELEGTDEGYIALSVNLPTVSTASRSNDGYDNGTADEYAVKNGRIFVYRNGDTESQAQFICSAELTSLQWGDANANGSEISTSATAYAKITGINLVSAKAQYSAFILLNYTDEMREKIDNNYFGVMMSGAYAWPTTIDGKYIPMTNAPRYNSTTEDPLMLFPLDKTKIGSTQSEANTNGLAVTATVQRIAAKVAVKAENKYTVAEGTFAGDEASITTWALDVTNKTTYAMQNTELKGTYADIWTKARFFGPENAKFRRVYWAKDPNYSLDINASAMPTHFNVIDESALAGTTAPAYLYCLENTFDIKHQVQGQTTRVVFKATYRPKNFATVATFIRIGEKVWTPNDLAAQISTKAGVNVVLGNIASVAGYHSLSEISAIPADKMKEVATSLGLSDENEAAIETHLNGESYYIARIKHFGDEETPWSIGNDTYGENNDKWLGRYGIVRNTSYVINVNGISSPGYPEVPEIDPNEPDDVSDFIINVSIDMLAWAKRTNNVIL